MNFVNRVICFFAGHVEIFGEWKEHARRYGFMEYRVNHCARCGATRKDFDR